MIYLFLKRSSMISELLVASDLFDHEKSQQHKRTNPQTECTVWWWISDALGLFFVCVRRTAGLREPSSRGYEQRKRESGR